MFGPSFKSPIAEFQTTPATTGELLQHVGPRHPEVEHLFAKMEIVLTGGPVRRQKLIGYLWRQAPDQLFLQVNLPKFGGIIRVTQNGEQAAVYLMTDPVHFYKGTLSELDEHPEALYGLHPTDVARTLLIGRKIAELLETAPADTALRPGPEVKSKYWGLATDLAWNRREVYAVRRADGLVEKVAVRDENNVPRILITYKEYAYFGDVLFPKKFDLFFEDSNMRLRVDVESVLLNRPPGERVFSTDPPPGSGIEAEPMRDWFAREDLVGVE